MEMNGTKEEGNDWAICEQCAWMGHQSNTEDPCAGCNGTKDSKNFEPTVRMLCSVCGAKVYSDGTQDCDCDEYDYGRLAGGL
jgi:hypothetical protein